MPTKQTVKVVRARKPGEVKIGLRFTFDADDPRAEAIYRGVGLLLREALSATEADQFLMKMETERAKLNRMQ